MREGNPFRSSPQPSYARRPSPFSTRMERTPTEAATEQRFRENQRKPKPDAEHFASIVDLHSYLDRRGYEEACKHAYSCDPWKYEPVLFTDLIKARINDDKPLQNELRELIRAGSWMTYPRVNEKEIETRLKEVERQEESSWTWRIRQSDPDTAKELSKDLQEVKGDIEGIRQSLQKGTVGLELETATRAIEDISARLWTDLKQLSSIHGLKEKELRTHHLTSPITQEIERLRPIRDLIYYRRLYPKQAARSLTAVSPSAR